MPQVPENTSWPSGVFRSKTLNRKVQERSDSLFSALGYRRRARQGFRGCNNCIVQYLSNHDDANDDPSKELFGIYQAFVQEAMGSYRSAIESIADASFSTFSTATAEAPRWVKRVTDLKAPARPLSVALRIANAKAAAAPGRLHQRALGFFVTIYQRQCRRTPQATHLHRQRSRLARMAASRPRRRRAASSRARTENLVPSAVGLSATIGAKNHRAKQNNASIMKILYPNRLDPAGSLREYNRPACERDLKKNKGTVKKCFAAAACRTPRLRHLLCPTPGAPGRNERTTSILGSDGLLPPRPSRCVRKRLPWEAKPHIPDEKPGRPGRDARRRA